MPPRFGSFLLLLGILFGWSSPSKAQLPTENVHGYIYLEPFEVRKEFALFVHALDGWKEKAKDPEATISLEEQTQLLNEWRSRLPDLCALQVDGRRVRPALDRIQFSRIMDELGVVPDEREEIPVQEALIAAVFAMPIDEFPETVELTWDLFPGDVRQVPVYFTAPDAVIRRVYTKREAVQSWKVPQLTSIPELLPVPPPTVTALLKVPILTGALLLVAVACAVVGRQMKEAPTTLGVVASCALVVGLILSQVGMVSMPSPLQSGAEINEENAHTVVYPLLRNIYHAFDFRDESRLYDTLAESVDGDLLERVYLEIRRGLELESQGGPRVKVNNLDLREAYAEPLPRDDGFRAEAEWRTLGTVTHWGHSHQRVNVYRAWMTVESLEGAWKLTDVEIIEEGRLN